MDREGPENWVPLNGDDDDDNGDDVDDEEKAMAFPIQNLI